MDEKFNEHFVGADDPNFVYDKKVDFSKQPKLDNSWDEMSDFDADF